MVTETRVDPVTGTKQDFIDRAAAITLAGSPAAQIVPTISGVATSEIQIDAGGTNQIVGLRYTVMPGDPVIAANNMMPVNVVDGGLLTLGESIQIRGTDLTSLYIIGLGTADNAATYASGVAGALLPMNSTQANYLTTQIEFAFQSSDKVNMIELALNGYSDGTTADNLAQLHIVGYSK